MSGLAVDVCARRGAFEIEAAFEAGVGETVAVLGPNGSGKSTLIDVLAGFIEPTQGRVQLGEDDLTRALPEDRPIGVVFQDLRLFPHLSALENAAFPLRAHRQSKTTANTKATPLLDDLGLPGDRHDARPADLSGGEGQRVALARALITEPALLLLDEPTSALDVQAAARLRPLLRRALAGFDGVCILVTHDPVEAMTLADTLIVMEDGRITQAGTPSELRQSPRTPYIADLVGINLYVGRLEPLEHGAGRLITADGDLVVAWPSGAVARAIDGATATLRPADVVLHTAPPEGGSARNILHGLVTALSIEGERARVRIDATPPVVAEVTLGSVERLDLREGALIWASCKAVELAVRLPV